jgi:putative methionine-R-sulfoxide reductase with GAF domain/uncharacterized Fe-S cluster protein YjdI
MTKRLHVYDSPDITVSFDPNLCKHTGVCLRTLPAVFDVRRARWVQPGAADPAAVASAVQKCPSGALQFYRNVSRDPVASFRLMSTKLVNQIAVLVSGGEDRESTARAICEAIAAAHGDDFVGLYDVVEGEIRAVAWSGPAPENPRFSVESGLCGAAVRSGEVVIANDVSADPRYITTTGATRAEMIVPVIDPVTREVLGTIDVASNSDRVFSSADRDLLEDCARAMLALWTETS